MRRLDCACVFGKTPKTGFLASRPNYDIHTRAILPLLVRLKLHDPWVCTLIHVTWFARRIKTARPLGLHYIARPLELHYNNYVTIARPLGLHYNIERPLCCAR